MNGQCIVCGVGSWNLYLYWFTSVVSETIMVLPTQILGRLTQFERKHLNHLQQTWMKSIDAYDDKVNFNIPFDVSVQDIERQMSTYRTILLAFEDAMVVLYPPWV